MFKLRSTPFASLALLELTVDRIAAPLFCAIYRAALGPADFVVWLEGRTGVFKTEVATLALQHFGEFTSRRLPANFNSTANFLGEWAFVLKDCIFLIDNFRPTGSAIDRQRSEAVADRLIQSAGDAAGRGRLNADLTARATKPPRGLMVCTAEESPSGHSTLGRSIKIAVLDGDISPQKLTALQADSDKFRLAMSCYIRSLAGRLDSVRVQMKTRVADLRAELAVALPGVHARTPGNIAELLFGGETFIDLAVECGAVDAAAAVDLKRRLKTGLLEAAAPQAAAQREEEPTQRFLNLLRSSIASGGAHLADRDGHPPTNAEAWGWRCDEIKATRPQGPRAGWIDLNAGEIYLDPAASFKAAQAMSADGHGIGVKESTLRKRLAERRLLLRTGKDEGRDTLLFREQVQGERTPVLVLKVSSLIELEI
jgi:hypothetical protein